MGSKTESIIAKIIRDISGTFGSLVKNIATYADTATLYIQKRISDHVRQILLMSMIFITATFIMLGAIAVLFFSAYFAVTRYITPDPLFATLILGGSLFLFSTILMIFALSRIKK